MEFYGSIEEMFEAIRQAEETANSHVSLEQSSITYGDYFIREQSGVLIYGRVTPIDEFIAEEKRLGASEAEVNYELSTIQNSYSRGYRYGWCYSEVEPTGELGSTHVSTILRKITLEEFEAAKARGWV